MSKDTSEQNNRGLHALGATSSSYDAVLVPVLLQKVLQGIKFELTRKRKKPSTNEPTADGPTTDDQRDFDHLLELFKDHSPELFKGEVEARKLCGSLHSSGISQDSKRGTCKNPTA